MQPVVNMSENAFLLKSGALVIALELCTSNFRLTYDDSRIAAEKSLEFANVYNIPEHLLDSVLDCLLQRIAVHVCGKNLTMFSPNIDMGAYVAVVCF